jgi:ferredoxin
MPDGVPALRRAASLGRLAALFGRHLARRGASGVARRWSPPSADPGLRRFDALYRSDRITALSPADREQLAAQGRCVGCGLCGFAAPRAGYLRPERLPSQLTRSLPDMWATRDLPFDAVDWSAGASVCPTGVPLEAMRGFVRDRLGRDGVEPPAPRRPAPLPASSPPRR